MFENGNMVNRFVDYWRSAGHQRIGFLYGRYEIYDGVPLGVRAVVTAIYEPPQETSKDNVQLMFPDPHEDIVDELAYRLGICRIGWIFTDLIPDDKRSGTGPVIHHRGSMNTLFLTAQECIMAGWFQNKHLNKCKYSPDGYFGSKFITVVVTGDASGQIQFEGYQVSNQCMALVKSGILFPTYDAPELGYIKETSSEQYVPDVYYKEKDSYNNEIMKIARPLPLEYLIIDIPTGFPTANTQIQSTFNDNCSIITTPFCIENRIKTSELQDQLNPLLNSLRTNDLNGVETWMKDDHWQTLLQLLQIELSSLSSSVNKLTHTDSEEQSLAWICPQCTFLNNNFNEKCDMCSLENNISS
ncbi:unnamed protein product [Rotaria sp. Silwood2]|nr:unnamed protein product [Rotaria sp. Silwood2]